MSLYVNNLKNKKAFTLIELIVTIAVLGILVLLGAPRLLGHVEKAELTRIQHDTKVMENKMAEIFNDNNDYDTWNNNEKDLGALILANNLFEKEGVAKYVDSSHLTRLRTKTAKTNDELGVGGESIPIEEDVVDVSSTYKIVPNEYKDEIATKLKGTFYVNINGKVYYEPNKPLGSIKQDNVLNCVTPESLDYEFEASTGTIIKYNGTLTHIYIPSAFLVDDECVPVRIIGAGAFQGKFIKYVKIPQSVKEIEENAFEGNELTEVEIPHTVGTIGDNAFANNNIGQGGAIVRGGTGVNVGSGAFSGNSGGPSGLEITYKRPTAESVGVRVGNRRRDSNGNVRGTITGSRGSSTGGSGSTRGSGSTGSSSSNGGRANAGSVISIPSIIEVDGEEVIIDEIGKGAYQGQGIIYVEFPETLERIEDYAFAGNQIIGTTIPENVGYIGNYAFAYNEIGGEFTMEYVDIVNEDRKPIIDNSTGNLDAGNGKIDLFAERVQLKNGIFITSKGELVFEEGYVGENEESDESDGDVKFYGEVSAKELISGDELAKVIRLTAGTAQFSEEKQADAWLKFEHEGTIKYVAKKPFKYSISWKHINDANAVFGNKTIKIAGNTYKVRLMRGAENNPSKNNDTDRDAKGSEWNQLMLPIHEQADTKGWSYPDYVEEDIKPINHKLGAGSNDMYNDEDLYTHHTAGSGTYSWMQETTFSNSSTRVARGSGGVSYSRWSASSSVDSGRGWRPVLELVE